MRVASKQNASRFLLGVGLVCGVTVWAVEPAGAPVDEKCEKPVYLTFDTGHMGVAPLVEEVLTREKVRATFFLANEPTRTGGMSLDEVWAPWWKKMSGQGHAFASHTFDHVYWLADLPENQFKVRPSSGPDAGKVQTWSAQQYCDELARVDARFEQMTGRKTLPVFRSAGGKTSVNLVQAAASCGYAHVGWAPAGFLGDELPSAQYPNAMLLDRALKNIRTGDILMAHLGIWSRQDPWAPTVLDPLIVGLKQKGFCFATVDQHPGYRDWIKKYARTSVPEVSEDLLTPGTDAVNNDTDADDMTTDNVIEDVPEQVWAVPSGMVVNKASEEESQRPLAQDTMPDYTARQEDVELLDISKENSAQHE